MGGETCIRLNELLQDEVIFAYSYWTKGLITQRLMDAGFELLNIQEEFPRAEFADIGMLVFYLRIISWQIADFNLQNYRRRLLAIRQHIQTHGPLQVSEHRLLIEARKPVYM